MPRRKKSTFGQRLLRSAREAARIERGELEPARVTRYTVAEAEVVPPPHYRARKIREIRDQMELSQPLRSRAQRERGHDSRMGARKAGARRAHLATARGCRAASRGLPEQASEACAQESPQDQVSLKSGGGDS